MIQNSDQPQAWFTVHKRGIMAPDSGTMHVIPAEPDHGAPRPTRYQRVLVEVKR